MSRLKRERIISTAVDLFYSNGLGNTTLEAVAEKMNVTKPFIYSHFKSKSDLLAEICSRGIRASLEALNRVVASEGSATDKVQALAIGGIVSWASVWYRPTGRLTPLETAEQIADLVLAMIRAKPGRRNQRSAANGSRQPIRA